MTLQELINSIQQGQGFGGNIGSGSLSSPTKSVQKASTPVTLGTSTVRQPVNIPPTSSTTTILGGGGGNGGPPPDANQGGGGGEDYGAVLARQAYEAGKQQGNDARSTNQRIFQTLLDSINKYLGRSQELYDNADQQITNSSSQQLGSNARTNSELTRVAKGRGRALGLGDSSKFNLQNQLGANFANAQGSVLANRGENQRANQGLLDERFDNAETQKGQANNYLQQGNDYANQLDNSNVNNYAGALSGILDRQRALQALNPLNAGGLSQFQPNTDITNTLNGLLGGLGGGQQQAQGADVGNAYNATDIFSLLNPKKPQGTAYNNG